MKKWVINQILQISIWGDEFMEKLLKYWNINIFSKKIITFYIKNRWVCMNNKIIEVQNIKVNIANINDNDYICISDFGKYKEGKSKADDIIRNWLRNRITLEFLGTWESIYNPNFNSVEFDGFRKSAGLHTFTLSVTE